MNKVIRKTGVIFIHGLGNHTKGYSEYITEKLLLGSMHSQIVVKEIIWSDLVKPSEFTFKTLPRKFFTDYVLTAVQYEPEIGDNSLYKQVEKRVFKAFITLLADGCDQIVFITHSLGTIIAMNFLNANKNVKSWDIKNTVSLITMGSPYYLYSTFVDVPEVKQIVNFYSKFDLISWIIDSPRVDNVRMLVGGLLSFWNPLSHLGYWTSRNLCMDIIDKLKL